MDLDKCELDVGIRSFAPMTGASPRPYRTETVRFWWSIFARGDGPVHPTMAEVIARILRYRNGD